MIDERIYGLTFVKAMAFYCFYLRNNTFGVSPDEIDNHEGFFFEFVLKDAWVGSEKSMFLVFLDKIKPIRVRTLFTAH